jgi:hypothetical protein
MLEIIALVFLTRNIGELAIQKGLKPGEPGNCTQY